MTNENFVLMTDEEKNLKLKNALLEKSDNCLTEEELKIIMVHISLNKQYVIRTYNEPMSFLTTLASSDSHDSQTLLGSALAGALGMSMAMFDDANSAAVITKSDRDGKSVYVIHVYIPLSRTQRRNAI